MPPLDDESTLCEVNGLERYFSAWMYSIKGELPLVYRMSSTLTPTHSLGTFAAIR